MSYISVLQLTISRLLLGKNDCNLFGGFGGGGGTLQFLKKEIHKMCTFLQNTIRTSMIYIVYILRSSLQYNMFSMLSQLLFSQPFSFETCINKHSTQQQIRKTKPK